MREGQGRGKGRGKGKGKAPTDSAGDPLSRGEPDPALTKLRAYRTQIREKIHPSILPHLAVYKNAGALIEIVARHIKRFTQDTDSTIAVARACHRLLEDIDQMDDLRFASEGLRLIAGSVLKCSLTRYRTLVKAPSKKLPVGKIKMHIKDLDFISTKLKMQCPMYVCPDEP